MVAKEYVAAQDANDPGTLILSQFAGAAAEMEAALLVNPYDPDAVGAAIAQALAMPLEERRARQETLFRVLLENDINFWGEKFLKALNGAPQTPQVKTPPTLQNTFPKREGQRETVTSAKPRERAPKADRFTS